MIHAKQVKERKLLQYTWERRIYPLEGICVVIMTHYSASKIGTQLQPDSGINGRLLQILARLKTENLGRDSHQCIYLKNDIYNPEDENEQTMYQLTEGIASIAYWVSKPDVPGHWSRDGREAGRLKQRIQVTINSRWVHDTYARNLGMDILIKYLTDLSTKFVIEEFIMQNIDFSSIGQSPWPTEVVQILEFLRLQPSIQCIDLRGSSIFFNHVEDQTRDALMHLFFHPTLTKNLGPRRSRHAIPLRKLVLADTRFNIRCAKILLRLLKLYRHDVILKELDLTQQNSDLFDMHERALREAWKLHHHSNGGIFIHSKNGGLLDFLQKHSLDFDVVTAAFVKRDLITLQDFKTRGRQTLSEISTKIEELRRNDRLNRYGEVTSDDLVEYDLVQPDTLIKLRECLVDVDG
jgi:hypothetical protein